MYLDLEHEIVIRKKDIIGLFDLDASTVAKNTREFLSRAEKNGEVVTATDELPKSFTVVSNGKKTQKIYISKFSSSTLLKRSENLF